MAIIPWATVYPGAVDSTGAGSMPVLTDNVDEVIASHPSANRDAIIELEQEGMVWKDNLALCGASDFSIDTSSHNVDIIIGSVLLDAERMEHVIPSLRMVGTYNTIGGGGTATLAMYDMGAPGTPLAPPELRSTVTITDADAGTPTHIATTLTPNASPGIGANQVFTGVRLYELRARVTPGDAADTLKVLWGGVALGLLQP